MNTEFSLTGKFNRAMVTGGAGFIGSHIVEGLLKDGLEVISIDDYSGGKSENLAQFNENNNFTEVNCDITDLESLRPFFKGVDIVFHQAVSKMTICMENPRRDLQINAEGTFNLLELARENEVKKFVHASSGSVYGNSRYFPTDENHPLNPTSYYGVSKLAGEKYVRLFSELHGMNNTILRYYHVHGPRQANHDLGGVAAIFCRRALQNKPLIIYGDGTQIRSFTYVKDIVNINKLVALNHQTKGESYNCASGERVSVQELANAVLKNLGKTDLQIEYRDWKIGDIRDFRVSNEKLKDLGMEWKTNFENDRKETITWSNEWVKSQSRK